MRLRLHPVIVLLCTVTLAGCATAAGGARSTSSIITAEDLESLGPGITVHEAIERLRPNWLRDRGVNSPTPQFETDTLPRLHVDATPYPIEALQTLRISDIQTIRFMDARDATTRFGTGYVNGLIEVSTRVAAGPGPDR